MASEPRKIVVILGNGFDLDLGLKTSYKDFWESDHCPKDHPSSLVEYLNKKQWKSGLENVRWFDLESELLSFALNKIHIDSVSENECSFVREYASEDGIVSTLSFPYKDEEVANSLLKKKLMIGLPTQGFIIPYRDDILSDHVSRNRKALDHIKIALCNYLKEVEGGDCDDRSMAHLFIDMLKYLNSTEDIISIYSFNYTSIIERFIENITVQYVHGKCSDDNIIIGAGDTLGLDENYDFVMKANDPKYDPPALVNDLNGADEVILYGHSLGRNDRQYFTHFFKKQIEQSNDKKPRIFIFTKDESSKLNIKRGLNEMTEGNLSALYGINKPTIFKTSGFRAEWDMRNKLISFFMEHGLEKETTELKIISILDHTENNVPA